GDPGDSAGSAGGFEDPVVGAGADRGRGVLLVRGMGRMDLAGWIRGCGMGADRDPAAASRAAVMDGWSGMSRRRPLLNPLTVAARKRRHTVLPGGFRDPRRAGDGARFPEYSPHESAGAAGPGAAAGAASGTGSARYAAGQAGWNQAVGDSVRQSRQDGAGGRCGDLSAGPSGHESCILGAVAETRFVADFSLT